MEPRSDVRLPVARHLAGGRVGPSVVCWHGSFWNGHSFDELLRVWAPGVSVWLYDLPGHGASALPPGPVLSQEATVELLIAALERDGIRAATLIGHSWGGLLAVRAARRRPDLIRELVLIGVDLRAEEPALRAQFAVFQAEVAQHGTAPFAEMLLTMLFAPAFLAAPENAALIATCRAELGAFPPGIAAVIAGIIERPDLCADAAALTQPVLLIDGDQDQRFGAESRALSDAQFRHARRRMLAEVGHMALLEDPLTLAELLRSEGVGA